MFTSSTRDEQLSQKFLQERNSSGQLHLGLLFHVKQHEGRNLGGILVSLGVNSVTDKLLQFYTLKVLSALAEVCKQKKA